MFFTDKRVEPSLRDGKPTESMNTSTGSSFRNIVTESRAVLAALFLVLFTACGESTTEKIVEVAANSTEIVSSVKDLPKCTKDNAGEQVWVKDESAARICVDGKWFATKESAKDTVYVNDGEFSCTTKELKDKSGLKIICNGDSIGVVWNGDKGEKGERGESGNSGSGCSIEDQTETSVTIKCGDSTMTLNIGGGRADVDTLELDSERIAISMDSLTGVSQKGPFLKGSTVYLYELSDGRTLKQTNGNFMSVISSDSGRYRFQSRDLTSQYALIVVDGKYRNEVTGQPTATNIRLQAYTNMLSRRSANVNLLTHLEKDRVFNLVTKDNKTVRAAKKQAQAEILNLFHIDTTGIKTESEDMDVFGKTDADAALLAISVLLQGDRNETDFSVLLTEISNDMESDGEWNGKQSALLKAKMADWAAIADGMGRLDSIRRYVKNWGFSDTVPDFEKFVRHFYSIETGLGECGSDSVPVGTIKELDDGAAMTSLICADAESKRWRVLTDLDKDTQGWDAGDEGEVRNGQLNEELVYVYQDGRWRHGTALDSLLVKAGGSACLKDGDTSAVKYDSVYYVCTAQSTLDTVRKWVVAPDIYNDTRDMRSECRDLGAYGYGSILTGRVNTAKDYVCEKDEFRPATSSEIIAGRACVDYIYGQIYKLNGKFHKCDNKVWTAVADKDTTGIMKDLAGKTYKTVVIGSQLWMKENMNYKTEGSHCYDDNEDYCTQYGRFYTWNEAMTVCPTGWHLPSQAEFNTLITLVESGSTQVGSNTGRAGYYLKSKSGWYQPDVRPSNGSDLFGFSVLPTGYWDPNGTYFGITKYAYLWTSSDHWSTQAYAVHIYYDEDIAKLDTDSVKDGQSVRCIQD